MHTAALSPQPRLRLSRVFVLLVLAAALILLETTGPARAAEAGKVPATDPSEAIFSGESIPRIAIEISPNALAVLRDYHQVWGQPRPERVDVRCTVREGSSVYTNVAIHLKGSYTFQSIDDKPSLTLNFDKFAPGQRLHGLDKIHLNNSVQDPSYLCEPLARELFNAAGVPAPRAGHARVSINGADTGFYLLVEAYNKRFLKHHFESNKGNLYDGGSGGDITKELEIDSGSDPEDRSDLHALVAATREPNTSLRGGRIEKLLDVDRFMTLASLEVLLLHWDGYCLGPNNYRLYHDPKSDRFVFMPHGMDQIFGRGMSLATTLTPKWNGTAARTYLKLPDPRKRYLERAGQVFTNYFQSERLTARVDLLAQRIEAADVLKKSELSAFHSSVEDLKTRIQRRCQIVQNQLEHPPQPIAFDAKGQFNLTGWQLPPRQNRAGISGGQVHEDDKDLLQIRNTGPKWGSGSWRRTLLLAPGRYEFSGQARVIGFEDAAINSKTNGVILRLSGEVGLKGLSNSTNWVTLRHEFTVAAQIEEELVCEFRGPGGSGQFERGSLKLRRITQ